MTVCVFVCKALDIRYSVWDRNSMHTHTNYGVLGKVPSGEGSAVKVMEKYESSIASSYIRCYVIYSLCAGSAVKSTFSVWLASMKSLPFLVDENNGE